MLTLLSTALSFLMGGLPKILDFFQDGSDKKHELDLARLQIEREMAMAERGFLAQAKIEEIRTDQVAMQAQAQVMEAVYKHDESLNEGTSLWVKNLRASVRPVVTYMFVGLLVAIDLASVWWAWSTGVSFVEAIDFIFDEQEMNILASIIAFWFGTQAFSKK